MKKNFKKSDLKTGMKVEQRSGEIKIVLLGTELRDFIVNTHSCENLKDYKDDLTNVSAPDLDIVKVWGQCYSVCSILEPETYGNILWEHNEEKIIFNYNDIDWSESTLKIMIDKSMK